MRYFLLKQDPAYQAVAPAVLKWHHKIDVRRIQRMHAADFPEVQLLLIDGDGRIVFPDVIVFPFLLVPDMVRDVIRMYEPHTIFKKIVLLNRPGRQKALYYMPVLEQVTCLDPSSDISPDRRHIRHCVLQYPAIRDKGIFFIGNLNKQYTVLRLDAAESMFHRRAKGIGLDLVEVKEDMGDG